VWPVLPSLFINQNFDQVQIAGYKIGVGLHPDPEEFGTFAGFASKMKDS
jgi:hypothetical protein